MKNKLLGVPLALAFLLASCVQSLHPLFTEKDCIFDQALVGTWLEPDSKDMWIFMRSGDKAYELIYLEKGNPAKFQVHLGKLGNALFLDLYPHMPETSNDLQKGHLLAVHTISRVWIKDDTLQLVMLDHAWLKKMLDRDSFVIKHERVGDQIVLTASTEEFQKFVRRYADDPEAFPQRTAGLIRQK
jgi:hypothetical protein